MKTLALFLPIDQMRQEAWEETLKVSSRNDLPFTANEDCPADLKDVQGRFFQTSEGYRITGRLLPEDLLHGGMSPATLLVVALLPVGLILLNFLVLAHILPNASLYIYVLLWATMAAYAAPGQGFWLLIGGLLAAGSMGLSSSVGMSEVSDVSEMQSVGVMQIVGGLSSSLLGGFDVTGWLGKLIPFMLIFSPYYISKGLDRSRAQKLHKHGEENNVESMGTLSNAHVIARQVQYEAARKDQSAFLQLGKAKGICTRTYDGFAPDAGLPVGLSANDLSTHMTVFGSTGTGKTSRVLRPLLKNWVKNKCGGALILDGKGALANELYQQRKEIAPNVPFTIVEPGKSDVGLVEGLSPEEFVGVMEGLNSQGGEGKEGDSFFTSSARQWLLASSSIQRALCDLDPGAYKWTYANLFATSMNLKNTTWIFGDDATQGIIEYVKGHPEAEYGVLADSIAFVENDFKEMDDRTRSNIEATVRSWLTPIMSNKAIRPWADVETGIKIDGVFKGEILGVNCPAFLYQAAGPAVSALIKARVYTHIRRRSSDFKEKGEQVILMVIDEAQEIINKSELDMSAVARSLGLAMVLATQSVDQYYQRLGKMKALAMLDNFRSTIALKSSPETRRFLQEKLGTTMSLNYQYGIKGIDYMGAPKMLLTNPAYDRGHPQYDVMRKMGMRRSAMSISGNIIGSVFETIEMRAKHGRPNIYGTPKFENKMVLDEVEMGAYLEEPFTAVVEVIRGGVKRHDVISLPAPEKFVEVEAEEEVAPKPRSRKKVESEVEVSE